jgi:penicillin amidase
MSKLSRTLGLTAGITGALAGAGFHWLFRRPLPRTTGVVQIPTGIDAPVEVHRDRWGVPHIYAETQADLFFAQGYVHAQDRLWQMDFQRRLVAGRLAEVLGPVALPVDRWVRILGLRRVSKQEAGLLEGAALRLVEAYVEGVNERIAAGRLPIEFSLLRYRPETWTVTDTLCWAKMMSWSLSVNWETELLRAHLIARLGPERAAELEPAFSRPYPYIMPPGVDYASLADAALHNAHETRRFLGPSASEGLGSNSWVIHGSRTTSGAPLLANDMHLLLSAPAIWYENHLVAGDLNVTGVTFPGLPGVVAGHNGHVAWGFTNGFPDVQDLYLERLRTSDDGELQYEYQNAWLPADVRHETIRVRGRAPVSLQVVSTRHGPIINELAPALSGEVSIALRWTSLEPETMVHALFSLNRAKNVLEVRQALRHWTAPVQNVVYADVDGNIGYTFAGKVPIRANGDGRVPVPGWTGEYEWIGYVPFDELPHLLNPPQNTIVTANNPVVDDTYPYWIGADFCSGNRAQRITELLADRERIDAAYIRQMQFDQVQPMARVVARHIGRLEVSDSGLGAVVTLMASWDGTLEADSPAAAVFEVVVRRAIGLILTPHLGDLTERYAGKGPTPPLMDRSLFGHRAWEWFESILSQPDSHWFDLGDGEGRDEVLRLALGETVAQLRRDLGPSISDWSWGRLHQITFAHILGRFRPLDRLFNRGPYPVGSDQDTIWATGANLHDLGNDQMVGPPFRFIADLSDWDRCLGLLAPGQSGQPASRHYADQIHTWFSAGYHPMPFTRAAVEAESTALLELLPAGRPDGSPDVSG